MSLTLPSQNSAWTFLNVHKKALTPLHRESLVKEMVSNHLFASIIVNILPKHVSAKAEHRAAIGFSLAVTMQYITQATLDSVVLAFLLQATMKPLHESRSADVAVSWTPPSKRRTDEALECMPHNFGPTFSARLFLRRSTVSHPERDSFHDSPCGARQPLDEHIAHPQKSKLLPISPRCTGGLPSCPSRTPNRPRVLRAMDLSPDFPSSNGVFSLLADKLGPGV
jgi:hypothetical protein